MIKVLSCVCVGHDWRLVLLAAAVCAMSVATSVHLYAKLPPMRGPARTAWLAVTGLVFGAGIWDTHVVAMLAFQPALHMAYHAGVTAASLVVAVVFSMCGFAIAARPAGWRLQAAGGGLIGLGVAVMHYTGMAGLKIGGLVLWDPAYVVASVVTGVGLATAAALTVRPGNGLRRQAAATALLVLAICGLHFIAMTAMTVIPNNGVLAAPDLVSRATLALVITGFSVLLALTAVSALLVDHRGRSQVHDKLSEAVEALPDGLAIFDADDRLQAWNAKFEETVDIREICPLVVGLPTAVMLAAVGRKHAAIKPDELDQWVAERVRVRRQPGNMTEQKTRLGRWVRVENRPTARGGVLSVFVDITDLKQNAEMLAKACEAADAANRAKSEFLANMSHEIRTPMNGIIGMNSLLLRTKLTPDQRKFANAVRTSADYLLGILNDILDVSKLEAGRVELEEVDFNLEALVEDVVELLSARALEKSLEIACFLDDGARRGLRGDPTRLRQILFNLLSNGLKFTERGFVAVEVTSRLESSGRTALRIDVHDTGVGLTEEAKAKLFQKFQQADGSITRRYGGTGLGLSICRQLVDLMGGRIGVDDRRGGGSTFWVEVSLANAAAETGVPMRRKRDLSGVRILVVDDIELNRSIFVRQLQDAGAILSEANGGPQGLMAVKRANQAGAPFDIVLLDHMMPELAGDDVAELIRADTAMRQPKLVLASSIDKPIGSDRAAKVGFDAFLTKPVRHWALLDCLAGLMGDSPAPMANAGPPRADPAEPPKHGRARILLAEDNDINTLLARTLLEEEGYSVDCVVDGAEAVEAAAAGRYDLILMDVQMPKMDGLEATRRIRAAEGAGLRTPIIAMTANALPQDVEACLQSGMDDHISKPIDAEEFLRTVARIISGTIASITDDGEYGDFDDEGLDALSKVLPAARFDQILSAYSDGLRKCLERIEFFAIDQEFKAIAREGHDLKGMCGSFGARRLQYLAGALEQAGKTSDGGEVARLLPLIQQSGQVAINAVARRQQAGEDTQPVRQASLA